MNTDFNAANVSEAEQSLRDDQAIALHRELAHGVTYTRRRETTMLCICGHNVGTHVDGCAECPCAYGIGEAARDYGTVLPSDYAQWARAFAARAGA